MTTDDRPRQRWHQSAVTWAFFAAWFLAGAIWALGLVSLLTIGMFILPVAFGLALALGLYKPARRGAPGLVSGFGGVPIAIAYLNRHGPGTICTTLAGGNQRCTQEWSPWPWLVVGAAFVAGGVAIFVVIGRSAAQLAPADVGDIAGGDQHG